MFLTRCSKTTFNIEILEITYDQLSYVIDEDSMSQQNITVTDIVVFIGILPSIMVNTVMNFLDTHYIP